MHHFTLAKHTFSYTIPQKPYTRTKFVAIDGMYALLPLEDGTRQWLFGQCRVSPPRQRQATFLLDDSSNKG